MRSELAWLLAFVLAFPAGLNQYRLALPGYHYEFPRDHFNHPDFQTEWWYYTGNVHSADGHRFGFELTFFRLGADGAPRGSVWDVRDLYLAHLALSDLEDGQFYHTERANRAGPGIAGISEPERRIWNGNWRLQWHDDGQDLQAVDERFSFHLFLRAAKPPVIHGERGVSQKAEGAGRASHYISLTRLITSGQITVGATKFNVTGLAWMDHEFFTSQLTPEQVGWDWLSLQLDNQTELMLFHIRRKDGSIDQHSSGTLVDAKGRTTHLKNTEFTIEPADKTWSSPVSQAVYPVQWRVFVPSLAMRLDIRTALAGQELNGKSHVAPNYWEGAVNVAGKDAQGPVGGVGYLEMTGYDRPIFGSW